MRQHVRGTSVTTPRSPNPQSFWPCVVTSKLTQSQEYNRGKRYSFVMWLLQICANVESALLRQSRRAGQCRRRRMLNNQFNFNMLQGYSFLILRYIQQNARADLRERATVSTTFSTEDRVLDLKENALSEGPQVRKNRGFPLFYFTVTTSKQNHTAQMARGPRRSRTGSIKIALMSPRTPWTAIPTRRKGSVSNQTNG